MSVCVLCVYVYDCVCGFLDRDYLCVAWSAFCFHNKIVRTFVRSFVRPFNFFLKGMPIKLYIYFGVFVTYCKPILVLYILNDNKYSIMINSICEIELSRSVLPVTFDHDFVLCCV